VEFLREHIPTDARVHYAVTDGGQQPNVVPATAKVWYLVRAPERQQLDDVYERVLQCAAGAAQMTDTSYEIQLLKAIWNILPNHSLENALWQSMQAVGPPQFSPEEREFAEEIAGTFPPGNREASIRKDGVPESEREKLRKQILNDTLIPPVEGDVMMGSTDVGDVSWCCPTAQIRVACNAIGTPGHSWQYAAQAGMAIGHRGMIQAGKMLAEAAFRLITEPETLREARQEFDRATAGRPYRSAMPPDHQPAFDQFAEE
ncbi:MAG: amidohydrolase, partial [Bacillota bacterium]